MTFEHQGLLFRRERRFHEVARERLRAAVRENAHVVLAVADPSALVSGLTPYERGRVVVTDRDNLYEAPGRALAALHRMALAHNPVPVEVIAEPPLAEGDRDPGTGGSADGAGGTADSAMELREWHRWESVLSTALAPMRMRLLCVHDELALSPGARSAVRATHPELVESGGARPNPAYRGSAAFGTRPRSPEPLPVDGPVHRLEIGQSLPRLRGDLTALGDSLGVEPDRLDSLVVAVNELAANVIEHGAGKGTLRVWRSVDRWVCDVFDERGGLIDPLAGYRPADNLRTRGYGLWITRQTCDYMEICGDSAGSLVRLHFVDGRTGDSPASDSREYGSRARPGEQAGQGRLLNP
ncbi:anti-sigma factor RsbA family regulatory protein [Nocardiopsis nanhaiensis]